MRHLGDITKISGYTAPIVDCIIGGSPCQDLSVAGKRAGLDGERSGLYIEQVRIVKEMRERDERNGRSGVDIRPRYMVWENVPGAFSSNKGEDFRIVLEEIAKVCDKDAVIPMPDKGKWTNHGCILGDGWSVAWRVLDAQFWGVPQRRRRIALVADFGGQSAPEILFVRQSMSGNTDEGKPKGKGTPCDAEGGIGANDIFCIDGDKLNKKERKGGSGIGYRSGDKQYTLTAKDVHGVCYCFEPGAAKRLGGYVWEGLAPTLRAEAGDNRTSVAYGTSSYNIDSNILDDQGGQQINVRTDGKAPTLRAETHGNLPCVLALDKATYQDYVEEDKIVCYSIQGNMVGRADKNGPQGDGVNEDVRFTLNTTDRHAVVFGISPYHSNCMKSNNPHSGIYEAKTARTLDALQCGYPACNQGGMAVVTAVDCRNGTENDINGALQFGAFRSLNCNNVVRQHYIVRRLTPLECERLQGYPDGWTDIGEWTDTNGKKKQTSDAARYKALGNSIALPPWKWVLKRLCACYERDATMASLFDGIGGFPYLWEQLNGKGSCLWASEIEEFPMAVTKVRIGE